MEGRRKKENRTFEIKTLYKLAITITIIDY